MRFLGWEQGIAPPALRNLFDDFCDSSVLGMRQVFPPFNWNDRVKGLRLVFLSLMRTFPLFLLEPSTPFTKN